MLLAVCGWLVVVADAVAAAAAADVAVVAVVAVVVAVVAADDAVVVADVVAVGVAAVDVVDVVVVVAVVVVVIVRAQLFVILLIFLHTHTLFLADLTTLPPPLLLLLCRIFWALPPLILLLCPPWDRATLNTVTPVQFSFSSLCAAPSSCQLSSILSVFPLA